MPSFEHTATFETQPVPDLLGSMSSQRGTVMGVSGTLGELAGMCTEDLSKMSLQAKNEFIVDMANEGEMIFSPEHKEYVDAVAESKGWQKNYKVAESVEEYHSHVQATNKAFEAQKATQSTQQHQQTQKGRQETVPPVKAQAAQKEAPANKNSMETDEKILSEVSEKSAVVLEITENIVRQALAEEAAEPSDKPASARRVEADHHVEKSQHSELPQPYDPGISPAYSETAPIPVINKAAEAAAYAAKVLHLDQILPETKPVMANPVLKREDPRTLVTESSIFSDAEREGLYLHTDAIENGSAVTEYDTADIRPFEGLPALIDAIDDSGAAGEINSRDHDAGGQAGLEARPDSENQAVAEYTRAEELQPDPVIQSAEAAKIWSAELEKGPDELIEDFTELLVMLIENSEINPEGSIVGMANEAEQPSQSLEVPVAAEQIVDDELSGMEPNRVISEEKANISNNPEQVAAIILTPLVELLKTIEPDKRIATAEAVRNIVGMVHGIHILKTREAPEAYIAEEETQLIELCMELFEAVGLPYEETDVHQFVRLLMRPELIIARPNIRQPEQPDLTKAGTREARHFAHITFLTPDMTDAVPRSLGKLAVLYANALKHRLFADFVPQSAG